MRFLFSFIFLLSICLLQAQDKNVNNNQTISKEQLQFEAEAKAYMKYKKYMYVDYMPKTKIPTGMQKNFYSDLSPTNYAHNIGQQLDTINQIHRLYITTNKAGQGFLEINKGALAKMPVDDVSEIVYIVDRDTVKTFKQISDLITLTESKLKKVDYQRTPDNRLMINVSLQK